VVGDPPSDDDKRWLVADDARAQTPALEVADSISATPTRRIKRLRAAQRVANIVRDEFRYEFSACRAGGSSEPPEMPTTKANDDVLNGATWHGEAAADLIQIVRDGREIDDPAEERPDGVETPGKIL
jgi:hypothetical protein